MDPSVSTSFIPKRPITTEPVPSPVSNRSVGILSVITVVVAVTTALSFGAVYFYQQQLKSKEGTLQTSITTARDGLGSSFVSDMKRLNLRIEGVKTLLQSHIVISPIFDALQKTTLRSVQYKTFSYAIATDTNTKTQTVVVSLSGTAKSYATIALQSDAYGQSKLIKNPIFSNLNIDDKTQAVNFKLTFNVSPADLSYQTFIDAQNKTIVSAPAPTTSSTATTTDPSVDMGAPVTTKPQ